MSAEKRLEAQLQREKEGGVLLFSCKGRIDALTVHGMEKEIFEAIEEGERQLIFEFAQVEYLSSAGMRMLMSVAKKLRTSDGKLVVCCIPSPILDLLKVAGFDHILEIAETKEDSLRRFS